MSKIIIAVCLLFTHAVWADQFQYGPLIKNYGKQAKVELSEPLTGKETFKVVFDVSDQAEPGNINRRFESLARFLNMHVANGIPAKNIKLALVVHGKAGFDLLNSQQYQAKYQQSNPNIDLLTVLMQHKVDVYICGQSAAYMGIKNSHLQPGIKVALSAMTANALLQQQGFSLNPF